MNKEFNELYNNLLEITNQKDWFNTLNKLVNLISSKGLENELYGTMKQAINSQNWEELKRIIFIVQRVPDPMFVPLLCELLEYKQFHLMEGIADALTFSDERSIPYIVKTLMEYDIDEDLGYHLRKKLIDILVYIKNEEAIIGLKQLALKSCSELVREESRKALVNIKHRFNV